MKRWKTRLEELWEAKSIKKQILMSMLACSIMAVALVGCITFIFSKRIIEHNYERSQRYNLEVSGSIIDIQLQNIIDLSRTLLYQKDFKKIFTKKQKKSTYFSSRDDVVLNHVLRDLAEQNKYIQSIVAIHKKGNIYFFSKLSQQNGKVLKYHRGADILAMNWVSTADQEEGRELFYGHNILFDDSDETFSMVKALKNTENGEDMGYIVFNIKKSMFLTAFGKQEKEYVTNRYMIMDKLGENLVYFHGRTDLQQEVLKDYISGETKKYLFSQVHNQKGDWEVVNVIAREELSRDSNYIAWISILVCFNMLSVCYLFSSRISNVITRPLELLKKNIDIVSEGVFRIEEEFDETEIGKIGTRFKNTVNNNLDLHEKLLQLEIREKESELLLLQSQINPHFLYNTLDSLYFMAIIEHSDKIADMVMALSDTFKLSLNRGEKLIEVRDEIEKINAYMKLQNMRYHDRFGLKIEIEESLLTQKILTFILQPVVENAVYHGLEPKMGDECCICISGCRTGEFMVFSIWDNGVGIVNMSLLDEGYGVKNIRARLSLFYGDGAEICFESEAGVGTEVTIKVPMDEVIKGE